jgi:hypothetical protein
MARKNEPEVERTEDGTVAVPVTADDPDVAALGTDPETADPSKVSAKRTVKDSEPLSEKEFISGDPERPYAEAVTDEHREFLRSFGREV